MSDTATIEPRELAIPTSLGPGRAFIFDATDGEAAGTLVLGHGAGRGTNTPDLQGIARHGGTWRVILFDQPWVVAGKRVASPPKTLDVGWREAVSFLREQGELVGDKLVFGGRSAGARVACRTGAELNADGVLALAFPLTPAGKKDDSTKWRTHEAQGVIDAGLALRIIQGRTDAFGGPEQIRAALPGVDVVEAAGPHAFSKNPSDVAEAAWDFLASLES